MKIAVPLLTICLSSTVLTACQSVPIEHSTSKFTLTSSDIYPNRPLSTSQVANTFGCNGGNQSPKLTWHNAPSTTKSYAITLYDPDAPTGSGFWHWMVVNIPATQTNLTDNGLTLTNDAGFNGFLGACPSVGQKHRYIFTVYALDTPKLDITATTPNAVARFMLNQHVISQAKIETYYAR